MVQVKENLIGKQFGKWTVISRAEDKKCGKASRVYWKCRCSCGKEKDVYSGDLKGGRSKSCGCVKVNIIKECGKKHRKHNIYDLSGDYGIGYNEEKTYCFYFDLEDYDKIKKYYWRKSDNKKSYVHTIVNGKNLMLHRLIMQDKLTDNNCVIDHINHIKIDNRKENLRVCSSSQNNYNASLSFQNHTGIKGVSYGKREKKWVAYISHNNKHIHLGYYDTFEDAVKARREAELKYCKGFDLVHSQEISTYPNTKATFKVADKYVLGLACIGIVLSKDYNFGKNDTYGQLPLFLEKVIEQMQENKMGYTVEDVAREFEDLTGICLVPERH